MQRSSCVVKVSLSILASLAFFIPALWCRDFHSRVFSRPRPQRTVRAPSCILLKHSKLDVAASMVDALDELHLSPNRWTMLYPTSPVPYPQRQSTDTMLYPACAADSLVFDVYWHRYSAVTSIRLQAVRRCEIRHGTSITHKKQTASCRRRRFMYTILL